MFEKDGQRNCENWSEIEFTSFGENAITSIFAKGWDSLRFSKKMVKKTSKIGQKMNSVSYLGGSGGGQLLIVSQTHKSQLGKSWMTA